MTGPDRLTNGIINPTPIEINWYGCKMAFAHFTDRALRFEYNNDPEFYSRTRSLLPGKFTNTFGLLHELGHKDSALEDFPLNIKLEIPEPLKIPISHRPNNPDLVAQMQLPQLYRQITDHIENYIAYTYRIADGYSDAYLGEIIELRALSEHAKNRTIDVTFNPLPLQSIYEIKKIIGQHYSYNSRFSTLPFEK